MSKNPNSSDPRPEIEPNPGSVPKKFPNTPEPLSTRSPKMSPGEDAPARSGSGEDPMVESGVPENDPEQPKQSDEEKSME